MLLLQPSWHNDEASVGDQPTAGRRRDAGDLLLLRHLKLLWLGASPTVEIASSTGAIVPVVATSLPSREASKMGDDGMACSRAQLRIALRKARFG